MNLDDAYPSWGGVRLPYSGEYKVETGLGRDGGDLASWITNTAGYNVLRFESNPGWVFAGFDHCTALVAHWKTKKETK